MKLLIQSAMIFFGTLLAAALVALGEPGNADVARARNSIPQVSAQGDAHTNLAWIGIASGRTGFKLR